MSKWTLLSICVLITLAAGCGSQNPPVPTVRAAPPRERTKTPVPATPEEAIRQIINAECEAVVQQDIDRLQDLWSSDGVVTDANHTPDSTSDDVTWKGWDAIRDRYVNIVFPSNPTFCEHPDAQVKVTADSATAITGVKIGVTNAPNSNNWTFKNTASIWKITALTYNNNPQR